MANPSPEQTIIARDFFEGFTSRAETETARVWARRVAEALARRVDVDKVLTKPGADALQNNLDAAGKGLAMTPSQMLDSRMEHLLGGIREAVFGEDRNNPPGVVTLRPKDGHSSSMRRAVPGIDPALIPADLNAAMEERARPVIPAPSVFGGAMEPGGSNGSEARPSAPIPENRVVLFETSPLGREPESAGDGDPT